MRNPSSSCLIPKAPAERDIATPQQRRASAVHFAAALIALLVATGLASVQRISAQEKDEEPATTEPTEPTEPAEEAPLPKLADMVLPEAKALLKEKPVDWVVLPNEDTLVVEPVVPRPRTLEKLEEELKKLANVKPKNKEEADALKQQRLDLQKLQVSLVDGGAEADFTLETRLIREIVYHEDLVLRRAERCIDDGLTALAFELLVYLDRRHHDWPGYDRTVNRLLLKEAQLRLQFGDPETALRFAEELAARNKSFPELSDLLGAAVDNIVITALETNDYRKARHFLARLSARDVEHPIYQKWRADLTARTTTKISEARAAFAQGDFPKATQLVDQAARIWPQTPGLKEAHRELTNRYQILQVGVLDFPADAQGYPFATRASARDDQLTTLRWFETSRYDEVGPRYSSPICESWDPDDLGRELRFTLRRDRADWESRPRLTSATLASELHSRLDPNSAEYDQRLASYISGIATPSPFEMMVRFRRAPLRPEAFFRFPLDAGAEAPQLNADLSLDAGGAGERFRLIDTTDQVRRFVRVRPEPDTSQQFHVAEVNERRYDDWDSLLQGLQRGEISAAPHVAFVDLAALNADPRFFVLPYAQPESHVIQFNPQSKSLQNGQLRRALLHGVPREMLLNELLLADAPKDPPVGRLSTSPFTIGSAAYDRLLPQPEFDPILTAALALTAKKELGELPPLKLTIPPDAEVRHVAEAMLAAWKRMGIEVVLVSSAEKDWDLAYRIVRFREPLIELWPFLTVDASASVAALTPFPERIRRQLMDLERAADWSAAMRGLHRLQADLVIDAWWIPLWELDEFCLIRRNITGVPERLVVPYQDIERWIVQSWYSTEAP